MRTKRILSILLSLVLVLGMLPGMSLTAFADGNTTTITSPATTGTMTITLTIAEATHSVTITAGDNMTTTGNASQTSLTGAMTDVVYTADDGYYFPTDYSVAAVNGITVTRDGFTQITVSGTPTADATITLTAPTEKDNQSVPETTGFSVTNATNATSADGVISGVTSAMEYSLDSTAWTAVTGTTITGLNPGSVQIRLAGDDTRNASDAVSITVGNAALISAKTNASNTVNAVNASDYIAADQETVTNAKSTALEAIENATTTAAVETALTTFNNTISGCTTQAAADLATAKTNATNTVNAVNASDYIAADQQTVTNAKTTALAAINAATTEAEVSAALNTFNTAIAGCTTQTAADLTTAKTNATNTVNAVNAADYITADQQTVTNAKNTVLAAINAATTEAEVTAALTTFNNTIAGCTTQTAADLTTAKTNATNTVNAVNAADYIAADQETVTDAKNTALAAINAATTEAEVTAALNTFNTAIAGCTTQTAADLTTAKTNATNTVNAVNAADYIAADQETVTNAKNTALAAINAATMEAEVTAALNTFNTAIAGCIKKADYIDESGVNQNHRLHEGNLIFTFKRTQDDQNTFSLFGKALVDNHELTKNVDYTVAPGSLILTLKADYLDTLALGEHTLTVLFTDGRVDSRFTVSRALDPTNFDDVAVESDSFSFKVVWQGGSDKSIDFTLYKKDGTVYRHGFDKQKLGSGEWKYSAWFSAPEACYVLETPMAGYQIRYENVGVYAQVTDRCCDGGTITIHKVPKTGDTANLALWMSMVVIGALTLCGVAVLGKRRKQSEK